MTGDEFIIVEKIRSVGNQDKEMRIEIYEELLDEPSLKGYLNDLYASIEASNSSKTRYWLSFLEIVEVLLLHYHSMWCPKWENYLLSIRLMLPWMAACDNLHNSRYLSIYWSMMKSLNEEVSNHMKQKACRDLVTQGGTAVIYQSKAEEVLILLLKNCVPSV